MTTRRKGNEGLWIVVTIAVLVAAMATIWIIHDNSRTNLSSVSCGDSEGQRPRIDTRSFETKYMGYSISIEGQLGDKGSLKAKLEPKTLQQLSESTQVAEQFYQALVFGYNGCAVSRQAYQNAVIKFEKLDSLARQIQTLSAKTVLDSAEQKSLLSLVNQYVISAQSLGA